MSNQRIILVSQFINSFGSGFSRVALIILVTQWFHQPLALGGLTFCLFVPGVLLAAPIGNLVDRQSRLRPMLVGSSLLASLTDLLIGLIVILTLKWYWLLVLLAIANDILNSPFDPAVMKLTVRLFDRTVYNRINAALTTATVSAGLFSGVLATIAMTVVPLAGLFLIDFGSYVVIAGLLLVLREPRVTVPPVVAQSTTAVWNLFATVGRLLHRVPILMPVLLLALLFNVLLAPNTVYLTQLATQVFHNLKLTGVMDSTFSLGFLLGAVLDRTLSDRVPLHRFMQVAVTLVPVAFLILGTAHFLLGTLAGLLVLGCALPFFNVSMKTLLQDHIPENDLARVTNSFYALINLTQPIGLLGIPLLLNGLGVQRFCWLAGINYLGIAVAALATHRLSVRLDG